MEHVRYCTNTAARERCFDNDALMDSALPALSDLAFDFEEPLPESVQPVPGSFHRSPIRILLATTPPASPLLEVRRPLDFTPLKNSPTSPTTTDSQAFFYDLDANKTLMEESRAARCLTPHGGVIIHAHAGATPPPSCFGGW